MKSSTARPVWDFTTSSTIWRILPPGGEFIVGETRDAENKTVSFFSVRFGDGRLMWEGNPIPEKWWVGIEAVHGGMLYLHEYPVPSMPDHRKIFAVDLATGKLLWMNDELAFSFVTDDGVYASKDFFDRRAYYELESGTGVVAGEVPAEKIQSLMALRPVGWGPDVEMPSVAAAVPAAANGIREIAAGSTPGETLRYGAVDVFTCYERYEAPGSGPRMREHLCVAVTNGGEVLFHEASCDGLSQPVPGTFFRVRNNIVYVKDRTTLRLLAIE